jgi:methyltransferase
MGATAAAYLILGFVTLQRLAELLLAERNRKRLMSRGASEHGRGHYPLIVIVHGLWLAALWWWAPGRQIHIPLLLLFAVLQVGRLWVLSTLGERWTTRIIILPGAPLVTRGPYRFVDHPNYLIVVLEIAVLPLVFGLWEIALAFSALNAAVLAIRIRAENRALASLAAAP